MKNYTAEQLKALYTELDKMWWDLEKTIRDTETQMQVLEGVMDEIRNEEITRKVEE